MFATKELVLTGRRAVVALVIAWSVASTDAGEQRRGKVFFSDPKELPPVPAGTPRPPLQLTPGEVIPRGGSLDGVTAPPFASPALIPQTFRPLPKRATADDDKDWLVKSVEKMNVGGDAIAKALGVRDYGPSGLLLGDDGENELLRKENSFLGNALRGTGLPGAGGDNGPDRSGSDVRLDDRLGAGGNNNPSSLPGNGSTAPSGVTSTFRERSSVFFSDSSGSGLTGNGILDTIGTRGQTERGIQSALNPVDAVSSFKVLGRSGSDKPSISAKPRDEFRELLGLEKPEAPLPKQQVIGGLGDNINTSPDLTKREINPVTPRPTVGGGSSSLPFFQESQITAVQRNPLKPPELEVLPGKAFVPAAGESSLAPVTDLRKRMMSPTVLPIPKRNF